MLHNNLPKSFATGSRDGLMSKEDKVTLKETSDKMQEVQSIVDKSFEAAKSAEETASLALKTAQGKASGHVFDTKADLDAWLAIEENIANIQPGTNLYIRDLNTPDYWWDGESLQALETDKVDMVDYLKKTDNIDNNTVDFTTDSELQELTSGSTTKTLFGSVAKSIKTLMDVITEIGSGDISSIGSSIKDSIINISNGYLKLTGGTLTGNLRFKQNLIRINDSFAKGDILGSAKDIGGLVITDKNEDILSHISSYIDSAGTIYSRFVVHQNSAESDVYATMGVCIDTNGVAYGFAPTVSNYLDNSGKIATTKWVNGFALAKTGGTLTDRLFINSNYADILTIKRTGTSGDAQIVFGNASGNYGKLSMRETDSPLYRIDSNGNYLKVLDEGTAGDIELPSVGKDGYIAYPEGGMYKTTTSSLTGYLTITLPQSWTSTMMKFKVSIFNYVDGTSCDYYIAGYNYIVNSAWSKVSAYCISQSNKFATISNLPVKFGHDGTKCVIQIGNEDTVWSYPQIIISDVEVGYSNYEYDKWSSGWNISFTTTLANISNTVGYTANWYRSYKADRDGDGNIIKSTYLKLTGGKLTGDLTGTTATFTGLITASGGISATTGTFTEEIDASGGIKGNLTGNADTATKLKTERSILVNLGSTAAGKFNGSDDVKPGISGTLPVANGGTGATTAANALKNLGLEATAKELNYSKGITSNIQDQLNAKTVKIDLAGQCQKTSYRRSVIALCKTSTTNSSSGTYSSGVLSFHRSNGLSGCEAKADIFISDQYHGDGYVNISILESSRKDSVNIGITPCTFTYNGINYGGVEVYINAAEASYVTFSGVTNFDIFALDYYDAYNSIALISEVNSSLDYNKVTYFNMFYNKNRLLDVSKLYTSTGSNTDGTMTQKAITDALSGKASSAHSHNAADITESSTRRFVTDTEKSAWNAKPTKAEVQQYITNLVDSSPEALNTLKELATALGNDPNFATTMTNALASKLSLTGGTVTNLKAIGDFTAKPIIMDHMGASFAEEGWYRFYTNTAGNASGVATCIFTIGRNYWSPQNEDYCFAVSVSYNDSISITQLSGHKGGQLIDKIRVVYKNSSTFYIDFHSKYSGNDSYQNEYFVYGLGYGTFQNPTKITSIESGYSTYEFETTNGCKSNLGFTGDLIGNADTASNASKLNGYLASSSATGNTIALRNSSGYLYATYFNQSSSVETPTTSSYLIYANSDGFFRKSSLSDIKSILGLGSAAYTNSSDYALASHSHNYAASNHSHTYVGDGGMLIYGNYSNEVNFGGTDTSTTIYFGYRATGSRPIPTSYVFGGPNGTGTITAGTFKGKLTGNADTATALTTSAGTSSQPVYFSNGKPVACSSISVSSLQHSMEAGSTVNRHCFFKLGPVTSNLREFSDDVGYGLKLELFGYGDSAQGYSQVAYGPFAMAVSTLSPVYNNSSDLGTSVYKWKNVYCSTGAFNGSDRKIKKDINYDLDERYSKLFDDLKICTFKYKAGTSGRTHVGVIAQDLLESMKKLNLDTKEFAGVAYDISRNQETSSERKYYDLYCGFNNTFYKEDDGEINPNRVNNKREILTYDLHYRDSVSIFDREQRFLIIKTNAEPRDYEKIKEKYPDLIIHSIKLISNDKSIEDYIINLHNHIAYDSEYHSVKFEYTKDDSLRIIPKERYDGIGIALREDVELIDLSMYDNIVIDITYSDEFILGANYHEHDIYHEMSEEEKTIYMVRWGEIAALNVAKTQQHTKEIDELKTEIEELKKQVRILTELLNK